ncbi:MAG: GNAT family acetyltransferase, partial [Bacillota bacterium]
MAKIVNVAAEDDYTLVLQLDNQEKIVYDMKPRLHAIRFCELADIEKFKTVGIENGNTVLW